MALSSVPAVEIDPEGTFKYILLKVQGASGEHREIVRGTATAKYHNHIFEKVSPEMKKLGFECTCLGGGKIEHNSKDKKIHVFGLSTMFWAQQINRYTLRRFPYLRAALQRH